MTMTWSPDPIVSTPLVGPTYSELVAGLNDVELRSLYDVEHEELLLARAALLGEREKMRHMVRMLIIEREINSRIA